MGPGKVLERLLQQDAAVYCGNNLNLKEQNAIVCKYIYSLILVIAQY